MSNPPKTSSKTSPTSQKTTPVAITSNTTSVRSQRFSWLLAGESGAGDGSGMRCVSVFKL
ncbi:hypothetical protein [Alkalisalibacterium limincola]|uniref:Uncharacterized protein n=1 Tax=Alkalisalibacterium limincola TaxID=2699169 RepID=A0A5C8KNT1_9GAMM|nr:hypothetical protein [Alkalisalibacterium limincola]TXK61032.1 hypothetical protein FU658_10690 [Alkalisalibacterium limincola]